jgi:hypothetical protein
MADSKKDQGEREDELAETKRIMERLVRTPPRPHKDKGGKRDHDNRPAKRQEPDEG